MPQARALAWHGFFTLVFCLLLAGSLTATYLGLMTVGATRIWA